MSFSVSDPAEAFDVRWLRRRFRDLPRRRGRGGFKDPGGRWYSSWMSFCDEVGHGRPGGLGGSFGLWRSTGSQAVRQCLHCSLFRQYPRLGLPCLNAWDLPKAYDASPWKTDLRPPGKNWLVQSGQVAGTQPGRVPYAIPMPPPNRTGTLHAGPGDHARDRGPDDPVSKCIKAVHGRLDPGHGPCRHLTQVKVEEWPHQEGMRSAQRAWPREVSSPKSWRSPKSPNIIQQPGARRWVYVVRLVAQRHTFDDAQRHRNKVFGMMFEDGIIERGYRVVNWDPHPDHAGRRGESGLVS